MKPLFASVLCLLSCVAFAQNNQLRLNKGQVIISTVTSNQDIDMGMGMQMNTDMTGGYELLIDELPGDSIYVVFAKIVSTKVVASGVGQNQVYNSETGEGADSELGSMLKDKIGKTDTLRINRFTGFMLTNDTTSLNLPEALNNAGEDLNLTLENALFLLPGDVNKGDKWIVKSKTGGVDSETEFELKSMDGKVATIEYKTKVNGSSEVEMQGMPVLVTTSGKIEGDFTTNTETGFVLQKKIESDLKSSMEIMGQTMEMTTKGKTTVTNTLR